MKNKIKESRKKMQRPEVESVLGGGRKNISPFDIIPYLPDEDCFFDSRHWVYGTDVLPFALTTRIAANNQQYLKRNEYGRPERNRTALGVEGQKV